jgi:hypothetical protein
MVGVHLHLHVKVCLTLLQILSNKQKREVQNKIASNIDKFSEG